ncbi:MAG: glycosyltransferase family 39 protein [Betaproteobacteria bacterium]|nr:glycosyltransferase family 39 protein [Betaproteobacteria bacterium]
MSVESHSPSQLRSPALLLLSGGWLDAIVLLLAALACFSTPLLILRLGLGEDSAVSAWFFPIAAAVMLCLGIAALMLARRLSAWSPHVEAALRRLPLVLIVLIGLALRLLWILTFPAEPGSDGATYVDLARRLVAGESYEMAGAHAYWPAGYPLFLAAWMKMAGTGSLAWIASNMVLFIVAVTGVARITALLGGNVAARLAALLFAVWPNLVAMAGMPEKEAVIVALLPWACWFVVSALLERAAPWRLACAGLLLGSCMLVQPSLQLLPLLMAGLLVVSLRPLPRALGLSLALMLGAALVVAPWSVRNYEVFGQFVLVSTTGGDNLYRANNPLATGGYTGRGEVDLSALGELEQDKEGKRLALEWMRAHPADFAALMLEKQIRFMGDDAAGIYSTLKVGKASNNSVLYLLLKAAANAWWLLMWVLLAAAALAMRAARSRLPMLARLPLWLWLYLFTLHSIFESAGKYHGPVLWVLPVLIACYLAAPWSRRTFA